MRLTNFEKEELIERILEYLFQVKSDYGYGIYKHISFPVTYLTTLYTLKQLEEKGIIKRKIEGKRTFFELTNRGKNLIQTKKVMVL